MAEFTESSPGLTVVRTFNADPDRVFDAFTTAELFAIWFGGEQVVVDPIALDATDSASWSATMNLPDGNTMDWVGEFLEVDRPNRVVLTMTDTPASPERAVVTVDIAPTDGGTQLTLAQYSEGFPPEQWEATRQGYEHFMDALEAHFATLG